jgi:hypothetical protein
MGVHVLSATDVVLQDNGALLFTGGLIRVSALYFDVSAEIRRRS